MRALLAAIVLAMATLAACGDDGPPSDRVPSLAQDLERVDEAIVERDFDRAGTALDDIDEATEAALDDGTLSHSDAARIIAAVSALREALTERPEEQPETPDASPTEEPPTSPPPDQDEDEDEGEGEGNGKDEKDEEKEKEKDKENKGKGDD